MSTWLGVLCTTAWTPRLPDSHQFRPVSHIELQQTGPAPQRSDPHPLARLHVQPHRSVLSVARSHPAHAKRRQQPGVQQQEQEEQAQRIRQLDFEAEQQDCWQQLPFASEEEALEYVLQQQQQEQGGSQCFDFEVPEGTKPGDQVSVTAPNGAEITFTVPDGAVPGTVLSFDIGPS